MAFGHERLDVYVLALKYVAWAFAVCRRLKGLHKNARDQLLRSSQAMPLNIAEGNGKATQPERRRYFEIARASALESAATQDVLEVMGAISTQENSYGKTMLERIVAMLTGLGGRGYATKDQQDTE